MTSERIGYLAPDTEDISPSCTMLPLVDTFSVPGDLGSDDLVTSPWLVAMESLLQAPMGKVDLSLMMGLQRASMTAASGLKKGV